jgi:hypothetical protein
MKNVMDPRELGRRQANGLLVASAKDAFGERARDR